MRPAVPVFLTSLLALTTACQPAAPSPAAPSPSKPAAATHAPSAPPTPALQAELSSLNLQPGEAPASWTALGWLDNGPDAVRDVRIRVRLLDAAGAPLEERLVPLALPWLGPGQRSPFAAEFASPAGASAQAEVAAYAPADSAPLALETAIVGRQATGDGRLAVLGRLTNPGGQAARVLGLAVAAVSDDELRALSTSWTGLTAVGPGQSIPFLVLLPQTASNLDLAAFTAARPLAGSVAAPIMVDPGLALVIDQQGHPIVVFALRNTSAAPARARAVVGLTSGGDLAALGMFASPIPLAPGEVRAAAVTDFPGLAPRLASGELNPEDLAPSLTVDRPEALSTQEVSASLRVEITQFETIGGSLYIRGTAYNQGTAAVLSPTVIGALRSTAGEVWSAGETAVVDRLAADAQADFLLVLPLPKGIEPSTGEFDVWGAGLRP